MNELINIKCCVCDKEFLPEDEMDFVCDDCQHALVGHCGCGNDDVRIDWGVADSPDFAYFWNIECVCGNTKKSRLFNVDQFDEVAKELQREWVACDAGALA
jgi:hypothetical protein